MRCSAEGKMRRLGQQQGQGTVPSSVITPHLTQKYAFWGETPFLFLSISNLIAPPSSTATVTWAVTCDV